MMSGIQRRMTAANDLISVREIFLPKAIDWQSAEAAISTLDATDFRESLELFPGIDFDQLSEVTFQTACRNVLLEDLEVFDQATSASETEQVAMHPAPSLGLAFTVAERKGPRVLLRGIADRDSYADAGLAMLAHDRFERLEHFGLDRSLGIRYSPSVVLLLPKDPDWQSAKKEIATIKPAKLAWMVARLEPKIGPGWTRKRVLAEASDYLPMAQSVLVDDLENFRRLYEDGSDEIVADQDAGLELPSWTNQNAHLVIRGPFDSSNESPDSPYAQAERLEASGALGAAGFESAPLPGLEDS